jgi:hypothetical protein
MTEPATNPEPARDEAAYPSPCPNRNDTGGAVLKCARTGRHDMHRAVDGTEWGDAEGEVRAASPGTADGDGLPSGITLTALRQAAELDAFTDGAPIGFLRSGVDVLALLDRLARAEGALAARDDEVQRLRAILADEDAIREDIYNALMQPLGSQLDGCGYTGHEKTIYTAGVLSGLLHASKVAIANDDRWLELAKRRASETADKGGAS